MAWLATALAVGVASAATALPAGDVPAPFIRPLIVFSETGELAQWFILELDADLAATTRGVVENLAEVPQDVTIEFHDLVFDPSGDTEVTDLPDGFATWTTVEDDAASFRLAPGERRDVTFTIDLPDDAEPGDHIGVVLVVSQVDDGDQVITRRVGRRVYATVPGDAARALTIESVSVPLDNIWFPSSSDVAALLRNDGRIRLSPTVTIRDIEADGPPLLVSRSADVFTATIDVPWWGGPVRVPVRAVAEGGIERTATVTRWVIPWGLLLVLALLGGLVSTIRRYLRDRRGRYARLQAELRRLEGLVTGDQGREAEEVVESVEQMRAMRAAFKNARRSGNESALPKLALAMHALGNDAVDDLLEAHRASEDPAARAEIEAALASYEVRRVTASSAFVRLEADAREAIVAALGGPGEDADGRGDADASTGD